MLLTIKNPVYREFFKNLVTVFSIIIGSFVILGGMVGAFEYAREDEDYVKTVRLVQKQETSPSGTVEASNGYQNDYLFTGQEFDEEDGLYYYGGRYYDPEIGRFTGPDPAVRAIGTPGLGQMTGKKLQEFLSNPQNLNQYAYARNNPVKYVDPTGLSTEVYVEKGNPDDGKSALVGHSFLETSRDGKETIYNWSPNVGYNYHQNDDNYYGADLEIISSDKFFAREGKNNDKYYSYTFDTSSEDEAKIDSYYKQIGQESNQTESYKNTTFNVLNNNCTDVVVGAMKSGGIASDNFSADNYFMISTPTELKMQLDCKFRFQNKSYFRYLPFNFNNIIQNIKSKDVIRKIDKK